MDQSTSQSVPISIFARPHATNVRETMTVRREETVLPIIPLPKWVLCTV